MSESIAILGCSRGFGASLVDKAPVDIGGNWLLTSRKLDRLEEIKNRHSKNKNIDVMGFDLSNVENLDQLIQKLITFEPTRIIYVAGGGPYGKFGSKEWKDHQWAFAVNFLSPAKLLHWAMREKPVSLKQIVFIGSAIAENATDPYSSSYAASKHGLLGLIRSVNDEKPELDIRLFSPGYMDTELLPPSSEPRRNGQKLIHPEIAAQDFWEWVLSDDQSQHFRYL